MPSHITRQELHHRMTNGEGPTLVEALVPRLLHRRSPSGRHQHPPRASRHVGGPLLPHRQAPIVVYCTGGGASSDAVAHRLEELGYVTVAVYVGGKEDWVEHGVFPGTSGRRRLMTAHHFRTVDARSSTAPCKTPDVPYRSAPLG